MKKEPNKKPKEFSNNREFGVILEKIYSEIKVIAEGQKTLKDKFDMLFEEFGKQKEGIFLIKADIRIIKSDIHQLKENVEVIKFDIGEIKESFKDHSKRLTHLEAVK